MFFVAWWTGWGYVTIWIIVAAVIAVTLAWTAFRLPDGPWMFGIGLLVAAAANWQIGRNMNRKSIAKVRTSRVRDQLLYRARNRFMSLPMETFSLVIVLVGVTIIVVSAIA